MNSMFYKSKFNGDISDWDVSNVNDMSHIFYNSEFNQDLTNWKPKSLKEKIGIFDYCPSSIPYWAQVEDTPSAVRSYIFQNELNSTLIDKDLKSHKRKI